MAYRDFAEVKRRVSIHEAAQKLGLMLKPEKNQLRGMCPSCASTDPRALVLTPERGLFYCFASKSGGDCLQLVNHITGIPVQEAAEFLLPQEEEVTEPQKPEPAKVSTSTAAPSPSKAAGPFDPEAYAAKLAYTEQVAALGITEEDAARFQIGFASTGFHRGRVVFPIRHPDGTIAGFAGYANGEFKFPTRWLPSKVVPIRRQSA